MYMPKICTQFILYSLPVLYSKDHVRRIFRCAIKTKFQSNLNIFSTVQSSRNRTDVSHCTTLLISEIDAQINTPNIYIQSRQKQLKLVCVCRSFIPNEQEKFMYIVAARCRSAAHQQKHTLTHVYATH